MRGDCRTYSRATLGAKSPGLFQRRPARCTKCHECTSTRLTLRPSVVQRNFSERSRHVRSRDLIELVFPVNGKYRNPLTGPRWGKAARSEPAPGHDVVFLVDCSKSMAAEDAMPNRLGAAIGAANGLIAELGRSPGNRVAR